MFHYSKLSDVVPIPKSRTTCNSFINPRKNSKISNGENQFEAPLRLPTVEETKRLIGLLTANATTLCMENHYYTIGGNIRRQADGGSIGSDLTGETARVYMLQWDKKIEDKCKEMGLKFDMYKRYVDDQVIVMRAIGRGWKYEKDKLIYDKSLELNDMRTDTERTSQIVAQIANSIDSNIQCTIETCEMNSDGRLPVLDMKLWIENNRIVHSFYKKKVSSPFTILKRSAISENIKKSTIFQECIR